MDTLLLGAVTVDLCDDCGSMFFDRGELEAVQAARQPAVRSSACDGCQRLTPNGELHTRNGRNLCAACLASEPLAPDSSSALPPGSGCATCTALLEGQDAFSEGGRLYCGNCAPVGSAPVDFVPTPARVPRHPLSDAEIVGEVLLGRGAVAVASALGEAAVVAAVADRLPSSSGARLRLPRPLAIFLCCLGLAIPLALALDTRAQWNHGTPIEVTVADVAFTDLFRVPFERPPDTHYQGPSGRLFGHCLMLGTLARAVGLRPGAGQPTRVSVIGSTLPVTEEDDAIWALADGLPFAVLGLVLLLLSGPKPTRLQIPSR